MRCRVVGLVLGCACGPQVTAEDVKDTATSTSQATTRTEAPSNDASTTTHGDGTTTTDVTSATPHGVDMGCGNGIVEGTEQCDDGNAIDDDACDNNCVAPCGLKWSVALEPGIRHTQGVQPVLLGPRSGGGVRAWGASFRALQAHLWIGEYDVSGTQTSAAEAELAVPADARVWGATVDPTGRLLVIGDLAPQGGTMRPMVGTYSTAGAEQWTLDLEAPLEPEVDRVGIAVSPTGAVAISAAIRVGDDDTDLWVAAIPADTPDIEWTGTHSGPFEAGFSLDWGGRVAMAADGTIYAVALLRKSFDRRDSTMVAFASGGAMQWEATLVEDPGGNHDQMPTDIRLDADANLVAAVTVVTPSITNVLLHARAADGSPRWTVDVAADLGLEAHDFSRGSLAITGSGEVIVVGELVLQPSPRPADVATFLARLDANTGAVRCATMHNEPDAYRSPVSLAVTDDGDLLVTGGAPPGPDGPTGAPGWLAAFR